MRQFEQNEPFKCHLSKHQQRSHFPYFEHQLTLVGILSFGKNIRKL